MGKGKHIGLGVAALAAGAGVAALAAGSHKNSSERAQKKAIEEKARAEYRNTERGKLTYDLLADVVEEECRDAAVSGEDKALIAEFYKYGFVGMMLHWIDGGMKADYRELVQRLSTMLHGSILNAARNFEQKQSASLSKETE